jgi:hypothetical protein
MSFKPEVKVGSDPKWYDNALVFATRKEAEDNAKNLSMRWLQVVDHRAVESTEPVNYHWDGDAYNGVLVAVEGVKA